MNEFNEFSDPSNDAPDGQSPTMPFTSGEFGGEELDPLAGATGRKRFNSGAIVIVAVVLASIGGLMAMRQLAKLTAATVLHSDVETTIQEFLDARDSAAGKGDGSSEVVLAVLTESYDEVQVPWNNVQRNPFNLESIIGRTVVIDDEKDTKPVHVTSEADLQERRRAARRAEMERSANAFEVKAIMGGSRPLAIINSQTVHLGESITSREGIEFRVDGIGRDSVELLAEDEDLEVVVSITIHLDR